MTTVKLKGNIVNLKGNLPIVGEIAKEFNLVSSDLSEKKLSDFNGKKKILNIFPSIDTGVCASSVRTFNQEAAQLENTVVICISKDLPFAFKRFCGAENITNVETLSAYRSTFSDDYNLTLLDSGLKGLCSRSIFVLDENNKILYSELVPEITTEPNYNAAIEALKKS